MAKRQFWFVVDGVENATSWSVKNETGERFNTEVAASRRATELAAYEPGKTFLVCKAVANVTCPVGAATINRLK